MREQECGGCPLGPGDSREELDRRGFLRDAAWAALAAAGALGLVPPDLHAVPPTRGTGTRADKAYPIPATDGVAVDRDEAVMIARAANRVYAFSLACPHQNTALRWDERNGRFQCPKHKSRYRPDGTFIEGRATRGLDRFAVRREADRLMVNLDLLYREDEDAAEWARAVVSLDDAAR